jgi:hypothetical protein
VDFAENFEDLKIWQRARALANEIYDAMNKCRDFVTSAVRVSARRRL